MKVFKYLFLSLLAVLFLNGCVSYQNAVSGSLDMKRDEANKKTVIEAAKVAQARGNFQRKIMIKPSEKVGLFLNMRLHMIPLSWRRDLLGAMDSKLVELISGMADFEVVNAESGNLSNSPQIRRLPSAPAANQNGVYVLTYNIINASFDDLRSKTEGVTDIVDVWVNNSTSRKVNRTIRAVQVWTAKVKVEVMLTDPTGKRIFTFAGDAVTPQFPSERPEFANMKQAVEIAASLAMRNYAKKYAPPMYVVETIGNGAFAKLSIGSKYGLVRGQKVRFYRSVSRPSALNPETEEISKVIVGYGKVGLYGAPVEADHAWVYVYDNDTPETNRVMTWTSAEIQ